ncbi:MAG: hypothetical protein AAF869_10410 [Pseudomonadota bacterium]
MMSDEASKNRARGPLEGLLVGMVGVLCVGGDDGPRRGGAVNEREALPQQNVGFLYPETVGRVGF